MEIYDYTDLTTIYMRVLVIRPVVVNSCFTLPTFTKAMLLSIYISRHVSVFIQKKNCF